MDADPAPRDDAEEARWILGPFAPRLKAQLLKPIGIAVLAADLVSKLAAKMLIDPEHPVPLGFASLTLLYNETFEGASLAAYPVPPVSLLAGSLSLVAAVVFAARWLNPLWSAPRKALSLLGGVVGPMIFGLVALGEILPAWRISPVFLFFIRGVAMCFFWWLALRLTRSRLLFVGASLVVSGGIGNLLGLVYSPRGVIDFLWIHGVSVVNLADIAIMMGNALFLAYLPMEVLWLALALTPLRGWVWPPLAPEPDPPPAP